MDNVDVKAELTRLAEEIGKCASDVGTKAELGRLSTLLDTLTQTVATNALGSANADADGVATVANLVDENSRLKAQVAGLQAFLSTTSTTSTATTTTATATTVTTTKTTTTVTTTTATTVTTSTQTKSSEAIVTVHMWGGAGSSGDNSQTLVGGAGGYTTAAYKVLAHCSLTPSPPQKKQLIERHSCRARWLVAACTAFGANRKNGARVNMVSYSASLLITRVSFGVVY